MKTNFKKKYEELQQHLPGQQTLVHDKDSISAFSEENTTFKYFVDTEEIRNLYNACYNSIKACFEENLPSNFSSYVYKVIFLFQAENFDPASTLANFDRFTKSFINNTENLRNFLAGKQGSSDNFLNNTNFGEFTYDTSAMRIALQKIGHQVLRNIHNLPKIQQTNNDLFPTELAKFKDVALKVKFPHAEKNMKLAALCDHYKANAYQFQTMLALMDNGILPSMEVKDGKVLAPKIIDKLPNVVVQYINDETQSQYYIVKLPSHDLRTLMLGKITGNCQTLGRIYAEDVCIVDGATRPNNGNYVIIRQGKKPLNPDDINWDSLEKDGHQIVGQSYAWIGRDEKTITWSTPILIKDRASNIDMKYLFDKFGEAVDKEYGFDRVTIGRGYTQGLKGAKNFDIDMPLTPSPSICKEGYKYSYSIEKQHEVYKSNRLIEISKQVSNITGSKDDEQYITSVVQGQALLNFLPGKSLAPNIKKILISPYLTKEWCVDKLESFLLSVESVSFEQLESIFNTMQGFYKYGMTIEHALKLPKEVLPLFTSLISSYDIDDIPFLASGIDIDAIVENIDSCTSIDTLKKEFIKLMTKHLHIDIGDIERLDTLSPKKMDLILENAGVDRLYKKHLTIKELAHLQDEIFDVLKSDSNYYILHAICNNQGVSMNDCISNYETVAAMEKAILTFSIKLFSTRKHINLSEYNENTLEQLPFKILKMLWKEDVLKLQNYGEILQIAITENVEALKEQISKSFSEQSNNSIPTESLQFTIDSENPSSIEGYITETSILGGVEEHI